MTLKLFRSCLELYSPESVRMDHMNYKACHCDISKKESTPRLWNKIMYSTLYKIIIMVFQLWVIVLVCWLTCSHSNFAWQLCIVDKLQNWHQPLFNADYMHYTGQTILQLFHKIGPLVWRCSTLCSHWFILQCFIWLCMNVYIFISYFARYGEINCSVINISWLDINRWAVADDIFQAIFLTKKSYSSNISEVCSHGYNG